MHRRGPAALVGASLLLLTACGASTTVASGDAERSPRDDRPASTSPSTPSPTSDPDDTVPDATDPDDTDSTTSVPAAPTTDVPTTGPPAPRIAWFDCGNGMDCGALEVPADYDDPAAGTIRLNLVRHNATDESARIGSLLVNPGGPGFGGTYLATSADAIYSEDILRHFDIVAWDPRGTDNSTPAIDCVDDYDPYFGLDITPDTAEEQQALEAAAAAFAAACADAAGNLLGRISTADTARDMDLIRQALDEDLISYFGFSYGSELGATWATMFPDTVRAAVLDGAVDPNATGIQGAIDQAKGFEIALNAFLAQCGDCAFAQGGDPGAAFDRIFADIDANAYPTRQGRPPLNQGIAYVGVIEAMYSEFSWPTLADALEAARTGDGGPLLDLYDEYYQRRPDGTYGNELEAFLAISCLDDPGPTSVEGVDEYNDDFIAVAPRIGPSFTHAYNCVFWPVPGGELVRITGAGAGPILVIGTTNDPATPYESSIAMARALEQGVFVSVDGNGHLGYPQSSCARDVVDRYLVDLEVPAADVDCG